ncbi:MAG: outer membrane lipoprotein carrier protein LolA [Deltaproteobacteria bacterium]|nr:outer membrane lipoprotein carrier protein LolA [Deltaproteobacteria bacterium]
MDRRAFLGATAAFASVTVLRRGARAASPLDDALADVAKARAKLATLQGPFVQERTIALLASKVRSTGKLWMVRPDRLRWELDPPDAATYWVLPDGLAYKTKAGKGKVPKGAQGPLGGVLGDLLVLLGGDLAQLKGRYDLVLAKRDAKGTILHATPRDKALAKSTRRIELSLGADPAVLERVILVEAGDDKSEITFGALTRNAPVDPNLVAGP